MGMVYRGDSRNAAMRGRERNMIRINNLKLPVTHSETDLEKKLASLLRVSGSDAIKEIHIRRRSVDARKKPDIWFSYVIDVKLTKEKERALLKHKKSNIVPAPKEQYQFPSPGTEILNERPVIIGSGPAGLFCAWHLAKYGYRPLVLERGKDVDGRIKDVEMFWKTGMLNPQSNVQFGEGGAGTFSDGKLNTLIKDKDFRNKQVLEIFAAAGAPREITYDYKPHIGTDVLRTVIKNIRKQIQEWGGEIRFESQVTRFLVQDGSLTGVVIGENEIIACEAAVLAIGHSARDTFECLYEMGMPMECKAFAAGLRIEHPQKLINESQYGREEVKELGAAPYKLTFKAKNGRGVYSFCMCPGGYVVNASSESGRLAVNGMSDSARDGRNANSALIITVTPDDFPSQTPLGGVEFQRKLEDAAYQLGQGKVPVQLFGDFKENCPTKELGEVMPDIRGNYAFANLRELMPSDMSKALIEGIEYFGTKIKGFDREDCVLSGVESRTSSPLRILRDENGESGWKGLYPCGEGAGYAGGITSAAADGIRIAEKIRRKYRPF